MSFVSSVSRVGVGKGNRGRKGEVGRTHSPARQGRKRERELRFLFEEEMLREREREREPDGEEGQ